MSSDPVVLDDDSSRASALAKQLNLSLVRERPRSGLFLHFKENNLRLSLEDKSVEIDFFKYCHRFEVTAGFSKKALLAKAIGCSGSKIPLIFDVTMGLARDSFQLAGFCDKLIGIEKSSIIFQMVEAARRVVAEKITDKNVDKNTDKNTDESTEKNTDKNLEKTWALLQKVECLNLDCLDFLNNYNCIAPEVIYIDPMFPEKKKSALPKKEMQILQELLPVSELPDEVFERSLSLATRRVVVKRAPSAPELFANSGLKPHHSVSGKSVRYDVYLAQSAGNQK